MNIEELRKLGQEATEGPWAVPVANVRRVVRVTGESWHEVVHEPFVGEWTEEQAVRYAADARFIATARNVWNALLDVVEGARECADTDKRDGWDEWVTAHTRAHRKLDAALTRLKEVGG